MYGVFYMAVAPWTNIVPNVQLGLPLRESMWLFYTSIENVINGVILASIVGLLVGVSMNFNRHPVVLRLTLAGRARELARKVTLGILVACAFGVTLDGADWLGTFIEEREIADPLFELQALLSIIPIVLPLGILLGVAMFIGAGDLPRRTVTASASFRQDQIWAVAGFLPGLAPAIVLAGFGVAGGSPTFILPGAAQWLLAGIVPGIALMSRTAYFTLYAALLKYNRGRRLPPQRRLLRSLADFYSLGLIRSVGAAYQFRHAQLLTYFASR
jgi:hypothetical protein